MQRFAFELRKLRTEAGGVPRTDWTSLIPELPYQETC